MTRWATRARRLSVWVSGLVGLLQVGLLVALAQAAPNPIDPTNYETQLLTVKTEYLSARVKTLEDLHLEAFMAREQYREAEEEFRAKIVWGGLVSAVVNTLATLAVGLRARK